MSEIDLKIFENQLRTGAGWPPLHSFTERELRTIRRREIVREKRLQYGRKGDLLANAAAALPKVCGVAAAICVAANLDASAAVVIVLSVAAFAIVSLLGSRIAYLVLATVNLVP